MNPLKGVARNFMALFFIGAGVMHLVKPDIFIKVAPEFLPKRKELIGISGILEILGGLGLLIPGTRRISAKGLTVLLYAVFPANINMAVKKIDFDFIPQWLLWTRLPLQLLLIWGVNILAEDSKKS
jgi:uncharacterized membrane protein